MLWQNFLSKPEVVSVPWVGGSNIRYAGRYLKIDKQPAEYGWYEFEISGDRKAKLLKKSEPNLDLLSGYPKVTGYLVGNKIITDEDKWIFDRSKISENTKDVFLLEPGIERFSRISAVKYEEYKYIFLGREFPIGPEGDVLINFQDKKSIENIPGVIPSLHLAFNFECWIRDERDAYLKKLKEDRERERKQRELTKAFGSGEERRKLDFNSAAELALKISGSELLDVRDGYNKNEKVVQFRFKHGRYECVVHSETLRIIDSGICLTDHRSGEKGDTYFTLESFPGVIDQALRERKLVIYRHAGGADDRNWEDDDYEDW